MKSAQAISSVRRNATGGKSTATNGGKTEKNKRKEETKMAKRRGNGEGSIYQDSDGRWRGVVDWGFENSKRKRKKLSGRTRAEVAER